MLGINLSKLKPLRYGLQTRSDDKCLSTGSIHCWGRGGSPTSRLQTCRQPQVAHAEAHTQTPVPCPDRLLDAHMQIQAWHAPTRACTFARDTHTGI